MKGLRRVAVDARILSRQLTGIGRYTYEMCKNLARNEEFILYLYSPAPLLPFIYKDLSPVCVIRTTKIRTGLGRQLWGETALPLWCILDKVNLLWGPAHRLPRLLPSKIGSVVTIHDLVWKEAPETMRKASRVLESMQMPYAAKIADHVITDSISSAEGLAKEFPRSAGKTSVIYPGVTKYFGKINLDLFASLGISSSFFIFVGTLEPRKNLSRLLEAYANLDISLKQRAKLVIVGGKGWGKLDLKEQIKSLGLHDDVIVLGYLSDEALAALYSEAIFLAMPSLYEGFGLPIIEAMGHGTVALTSNISSMPEACGDAGLLVDPLDVESIKDSLNTLILDNALRAKLAKNIPAHLMNFDWELAAQQASTVFMCVITDRGRGGESITRL